MQERPVLDPEQIIKNLTELHIGEPVVHIEHGIGRYLGLMTLEIDGSPNEFLTWSTPTRPSSMCRSPHCT